LDTVPGTEEHNQNCIIIIIIIAIAIFWAIKKATSSDPVLFSVVMCE